MREMHGGKAAFLTILQDLVRFALFALRLASISREGSKPVDALEGIERQGR
jgi:hypothetical protein